MLIKNYEVDFEEDAPDVRMIGGIRGIKALRVQREYIPDVEIIKMAANPFHKYEEGLSSGKKERNQEVEEEK